MAATSLTLGWTQVGGGANAITLGEPNGVELTLTNDSGNNVTFNECSSPPANPASVGQGSGIFVAFGGLVDAGEIDSIGLSDPGNWAIAFSSPYLVLYPVSTTPPKGPVLASGASLTFNLTNVQPSPAAVAGMSYSVTAQVAVTSPTRTYQPQAVVVPSGAVATGAQPMDLVVGLAGTDKVFTGGQSNQLMLYLTNPSSDALVPDGLSSWTSPQDPPTFGLTFIYSDIAGTGPVQALTTSVEAGSIGVKICADADYPWNAPASVGTGLTGPQWQFTPLATAPEGTPGRVLGPGQTVGFDISNIMATAPSLGLTYAYVSWTNVPGIIPGFYAIEILKVEPIVISNFNATPQSGQPDEWGGTGYDLNVDVANAGYVMVTNTTFAQATNDTLTTTVPVTAYGPTSYTLVASNFETGQVLTAQADVDLTPSQNHLVPSGAILMWSGAAADIPQGWLLCDGMNGTPDLRSRFVLGAGGTDVTTGAHGPQVNDIGGSSIHTHSAYANDDGSHNHAWPSDLRIAQHQSGSDVGDTWSFWDNNGQSGLQQMPDAGLHTHTVTNAVSENLPPWYALCYIMRS